MTEKPPTNHRIHPSLEALAVPLDSLNLDPKNARVHSPANLAAIRRSLQEFGQRAPVVVQEQGRKVIAGNARVQCARDLGWTHVAAVIVDEADPAAAAYGLIDNKSGELAAWDPTALAEVLRDLAGTEHVRSTGFTEAEIGRLVGALQEQSGESEVDRLADAIRSEKDQVQAGESATALAARIVDRLREALFGLAEREPKRLLDAHAVILPTIAGREFFILVDPATTDAIAELRRNAEADHDAGADTPLETWLASVFYFGPARKDAK